MELSAYITYCVALAIAAAIPGPGIIALVARALGSGTRQTLPMLVGIALGDIVYLVGAVLGLAYLAATFGSAFIVIKYCGVAYLAWMALGMWRSGVTLDAIEAKAHRGGIHAFIAGFLVTLSNPKTMVFYLALLPSLMDLETVTMSSLSVLIVLTFAVLFLVLLPYIILAGRARSFLQTPRALSALNKIAASFLGGAATMIAVRST